MNLYARPLTVRAPGPIGRWDGVLLSDATFQDAPEWTSTDAWVADDSPGLAYSVPPTPAVRVGVQVGEGETLTVVVTASRPDDGTNVYGSVIDVGQHGWTLHVGAVTLALPAEQGAYVLEVWVDGPSPEATRTVWFVLGERVARELGAPRDEAADARRFLDPEELAEQELESRRDPGLAVDELLAAVDAWAQPARVMRLFVDARADDPGTVVDWVDPAFIDTQSLAVGRVVAAVQRLTLLTDDESVHGVLREVLRALDEVVVSLGDRSHRPDVGGLDGTPGAVERAVAGLRAERGAVG